MNRLYSVAEIRAIEHAAAAVLPDGALMQRAGQSGANAALDLLPFSTEGAKVLVLAGPGNNGGDALEAAAHLAYAGATVTVLHYPPTAEPSTERAAALQRARLSEVRFIEVDGDNGRAESAESAELAGSAGMTVAAEMAVAAVAADSAMSARSAEAAEPPEPPELPQPPASADFATSAELALLEELATSMTVATAAESKMVAGAAGAIEMADMAVAARPSTSAPAATGAGSAGVTASAASAAPAGSGASANGSATAGGVEALVAGTEWSLVVDGLFGIGLKRPVTGAMAALVAAVNELKCQVLALDVPSGLDADTGAIVGAGGTDGADGVAIRATHTITFIADKPGLHTCEGRDYAGLVDVSRLEIDAALFPPASMHVNDVKLFARHLRPRQHSSHKGSYGSVAVIGGAHGMRGAPLLAARTALHSGAGRVYALFVDEPLPCDSGQPELMCRAADDFDLETATLVIGPGLGASPAAAALLARAIDSHSALLADADALNLIAATPALQAALAARKLAAVLTPHPLEAARLLGRSVGEVQADRVGSARELAASLNAVVILKGSGTVIAAATGGVVINTTGNPALATAGTGDVLAGLCGGLLAQGWPQWEAALAAVWLHGMAADVLVADGAGPIGLTAGELIPAIRMALNRMVRHQGR
jgi:hydroxyethylthiazole kinase-like uncharacterized protein yjeF